MMSELLRELKKDNRKIHNCQITPKGFTDMLKLIDAGTINGKIAKTIFPEMYQIGKPAELLIKEKGLIQISDDSKISELVEEVLERHKFVYDSLINQSIITVLGDK